MPFRKRKEIPYAYLLPPPPRQPLGQVHSFRPENREFASSPVSGHSENDTTKTSSHCTCEALHFSVDTMPPDLEKYFLGKSLEFVADRLEMHLSRNARNNKNDKVANIAINLANVAILANLGKILSKLSLKRL